VKATRTQHTKQNIKEKLKTTMPQRELKNKRLYDKSNQKPKQKTIQNQQQQETSKT
jgi:hypothetical protein